MRRPGTRLGSRTAVRRRLSAHQAAVRSERLPGGQQVITGDGADPHLNPEALRDLAHRGREPAGIEPSGLGNDSHPALERIGQAFFELLDERAGIPGLGVLGQLPPENQHGELGQVIAGDHIDRTAVELLAHR